MPFELIEHKWHVVIDITALQSEDDVVLLSHAAHIQDSVTHAAQCRVDAHTGGVGNFLEAHVLVVSHDEHLALAIGQCLDQPPHVVVNLSGDDIFLDCAVGQLLAVKDIHLVIVG